jgi:hypothetical protein
MALRRLGGALLIVAFGVAIAGFGWYSLQEEQADLNNAIEHEGEIRSVDIEEDVTRRDRDDDGIRETDRSYDPIVRYTYEYGGESYTSQSLFPGPDQTFDSRSGAEDYTEEYEAGQTVTVYVNEQEPGSAFLVRKSSSLEYKAMMGIGGVVAVLGLLSPFFRR